MKFARLVLRLSQINIVLRVIPRHVSSDQLYRALWHGDRALSAPELAHTQDLAFCSFLALKQDLWGPALQ